MRNSKQRRDPNNVVHERPFLAQRSSLALGLRGVNLKYFTASFQLI